MRIAYLVAGAGGMYCGSCLRDNRLAAKFMEQGRDVLLMPLYTPIRTDEVDVSVPRVHYGGINVYLQNKFALFRHTPWTLDRLLDLPALLRGVGRFAAKTRAEELGALTVSVLEGERGAQRKELRKLIADLRRLKPALVHLPMLLFVGMAGSIRNALGAPVVCSLSGEDIFTDALPEPYRARVFALIREHARDVDAYIAPTRYYAAHAAQHFGLDPIRIHLATMGIRADDFARSDEPPAGPFTIGYFARICLEKGIANVAAAFIRLRETGRDCRLRIAGYLGAADRPAWEEVRGQLEACGLSAQVDFVGEVDRKGKIDFLHSLHVMSVPTVYPEAKGFYVLEALAAGVPVVQPRHGAFPEILEATGGGMLYDPAEAQGLANAIAALMDDDDRRRQLGRRGQEAVGRLYNDDLMAEQTWAIYQRFLGSAG